MLYDRCQGRAKTEDDSAGKANHFLCPKWNNNGRQTRMIHNARMSRTVVSFSHSRPAVPSDPRDTDPCRYFWMKVSGRGMAGRGGALNPPTGWEICRINPTNFFLNEGTPEPRPPLSRLMVPRGLTQALVCSKPQTHTKTCVFRVCLHGDPRSAVPHPRTPTPLTLLLARWDVRWAPDWSCCTRSR